MSKLSKVQAGYLPAKFIPGLGTKCETCRDYIPDVERCVIVDPPKVHPTRGTCQQYLAGPVAKGRKPLRIIPQQIVGYVEGPEVPTFCGRCEYYADPRLKTAECAKVGDDAKDTVEFRACCNLYHAAEN